MIKTKFEYLDFKKEISNIIVTENNDISVCVNLRSSFSLPHVIQDIKQEIDDFMKDNNLTDLSINQEKGTLTYIIHLD